MAKNPPPRRKGSSGPKQSRGEQAAAKAAADEEWKVVLRAHFKKRHRQKIAGWTLLGLAPIIFLTHIMEHVGTFNVMSTGLEDIFIGFPTVGIMLVVGVFLLGQSDDPPKRPSQP